jgi:hypothetical protein
VVVDVIGYKFLYMKKEIKSIIESVNNTITKLRKSGYNFIYEKDGNLYRDDINGIPIMLKPIKGFLKTKKDILKDKRLKEIK